MGKYFFAVPLLSALFAPAAFATEAAPAAAEPAIVDAATYAPKTEHDNTPWRFNMEQNGKRMSADEFDAWMKARGVRVAKGAAAPAEGAPPVTQALQDK